MIIRKDKSFETKEESPDVDWYNEDNYVIDETTEEGQLLAQKVFENYPFIDFEVDDNNFITKVIVLGKPEKPPEVEGKEIELAKNEQGEWEYIYVDIPLTKEQIIEAKVEQQDMVIEEILFDIIPNLLGGMGGE